MDFVGLWALCRRWKREEISNSFSNISLDFPCREYLDFWSLLAISDNSLGLTLTSFLSMLPSVFQKYNPKVDFGHFHSQNITSHSRSSLRNLSNATESPKRSNRPTSPSSSLLLLF